MKGTRQDWERQEVSQQDTGRRLELERQGYRYDRTSHDSDSRSPTYLQRIDIYRKPVPELPCPALCLCTKCLTRMDAGPPVNQDAYD